MQRKLHLLMNDFFFFFKVRKDKQQDQPRLTKSCTKTYKTKCGGTINSIEPCKHTHPPTRVSATPFAVRCSIMLEDDLPRKLEEISDVIDNILEQMQVHCQVVDITNVFKHLQAIHFTLEMLIPQPP